MEGRLIICRCEEITREEVLEAIRSGASSVNGVKRWTRAGMGLCQGNSCWKLVARIVAEELGKDISEIPPPTVRPPVRPIKMSSFLSGEEDVP